MSERGSCGRGMADPEVTPPLPRPPLAGGAVLVVEAALAGGGAERGRALLLSLNMLLQTRGRERSGAEYRALAARAGFPRLRLRRPGGPYAAMLARK